MADERSFNRRCLDNVCALIEGRTTTDVIDWANTSGINIKKETFKSLLDRKRYFERLVAMEEGTYVPFRALQVMPQGYAATEETDGAL